MTEIPEHLLKRSKERRAALGLGGDEGDGGTEAGSEAGAGGAAAAPARAETAAPAPVMAAPSPEAAVAAPPPPDPPFVAAARQRRKVPYWVVPVLAFLPFWALLYANVLEVEEASASGLLEEGAALFGSNCVSCHGAQGGGGVGPQLSGGEVLATFPSIDDQIELVRNGSEVGVAYGDPARAGGQRVARGGMPAFGGSLTDEQLLAVVCHERVTLSGGDDPECTEGGGGEGGDGDSGGGSGAGGDEARDTGSRGSTSADDAERGGDSPGSAGSGGEGGDDH